MSSYDSKSSQVQARQLEAQSVIATANLVSAACDAPDIISIDNSTIATTVITLSLSEAVKKCFVAKVTNRATGAVVALLAAPSLAVAQKISVSVDATGLTDVAIEFVYAVA
jgi:hypothetical protein